MAYEYCDQCGEVSCDCPTERNARKRAMDDRLTELLGPPVSLEDWLSKGRIDGRQHKISAGSRFVPAN